MESSGSAAGDVEVDGDGGEEDEEEGRKPIFKKNPVTPSREEIEAHMRTHIPYRSWCRHCVAGRGRNDPHRTGAGVKGGHEHPHVAIDYAFLKAKADASDRPVGTMPILVVMEAKYKLAMAMAVPGKGNAAPWVAKRLADWMDSLGSAKVTLKCDNEEAIVALAIEARRMRREGSVTILEHPEEYESQSNHLAESGVNVVKGLIRTLKSNLEENLGITMAQDHPLLPWIVEHAPQLRNRFLVGSDGKTAVERLRGRAVARPMFELGEKVMFLPLKGARAGDYDARFAYGVYLGCRGHDGQAIVGTHRGVLRCRTVRPVDAGSKWDASFVDTMKGTPWAPDGNNVGVINIRVDVPKSEEVERMPRPLEMGPEVARRRMKLTKQDFAQHGMTARCPGCAAIRRGGPAANHTERCRERVEAEIAKTPEGATRLERAKHRFDEAVAEAFEKRLRVGEPSAERPSDQAVQEPDRSPIRADGRTGGAGEEPDIVMSDGAEPMEDSQQATGGSSMASGSTDPAPQAQQPREAELEQTAKRPRLEVLERDIAQMDVQSQTRPLETVRKFGMEAGAVLDLRTRDEHGLRWDFDDPQCRREALSLVRTTRPKLLVGSSECTAFSQLSAMKRGSWETEAGRRARRRAEKHLVFCTLLYHEQMGRGDWFLHQHPAGSSSWTLPCMARLAANPEVLCVTGHMCAHGMWSWDAQGPGLVRTAVGYLTNSPRVAARVGVKCKGGHRHVRLAQGMLKQIVEYPDGLCSAIGAGLQEEIQHCCKVGEANVEARATQRILANTKEPAERLQDLLHSDPAPRGERPQDLTAHLIRARRARSRRSPGGKIVEDLASLQKGHYWDDARGGWLDPELVVRARREEMEYVHKHRVYERIPRAVCWQETGRPPIRTGWVDTNKGTAEEPNIRSRWVAKEFNTGPRPDLFAATSPLEGVKLVISEAASSKRADTVLLIVDVRRAYFYARAQRRVFVELPSEDWQDGDEDRCGVLRASLYGTRDAARNWEQELGNFLNTLGLEKGGASTCLFRDSAKGICAAVVGDDVTCKASRQQAEDIVERVKEKFEVKIQMIGQDADLSKRGAVLNRIIKWGRHGISIEADPRHQVEVIRALGLESANPVTTPGVAGQEDRQVERERMGGPSVRASESSVLESRRDPRERKWESSDGPTKKGRLDATEAEELCPEDATLYRAVAARLNYLAIDRPDLSIATMRLCSRMSRPSQADLTRMKRVGRYLLHRPRLECMYRWQGPDLGIHVYSDSDWAADRVSRKSVSAGALFHGDHLIRTWSKQQTLVATSSAEAELYAANRAASEALGVQSYLKDLGKQKEVTLYLDASAALALTQRTGLGKAKHIEVQHLWLQQAVRSGRLKCGKVHTNENPADLGTKHLSADRVTYLVDLMGCKFIGADHDHRAREAMV